MCKKPPEKCKAKVKCKVCPSRKEKLQKEFASPKEYDKISLNDMDNMFEQNQYIISVKGE